MLHLSSRIRSILITRVHLQAWTNYSIVRSRLSPDLFGRVRSQPVIRQTRFNP
jgi:hypothetical protein